MGIAVEYWCVNGVKCVGDFMLAVCAFLWQDTTAEHHLTTKP